MKSTFAAILNSLPPQMPRSRLEPYGELIREMRKRGRTYREITEVLRDQFGLNSGISTVRDFVLTHTKTKRGTKKKRRSFAGAERNQKALTDAIRKPRAVESIRRNDEESDGSRLSKPDRKARFEYNPDEPLRIMRK